MAIFGFALGALLVVCGLGSLAFALSLVPTDMGMLYAVCGVILVGCGSIVLAIAGLTARLGRWPPRPAALPRFGDAPAHEESQALEGSQALERNQNFERNQAAPEAPPQEAAVFETDPDAAEETPQGPHVIGRYSSGSGRYLVFSDGAVEAETAEGAFRFDSLNDFKAYIASRTG